MHGEAVSKRAAKRLKSPYGKVGKEGWSQWAQQQKPANMKVPDSWVGGPNKWSREERDQWKAFCLDPKGGDPHAGAGSRGRAVSFGAGSSSVDELYDRMVARGLVVRET